MTPIEILGIVYALGAFFAAALYCLFCLRRAFAGEPFTGHLGGYLFVLTFWPVVALGLLTRRPGVGLRK